MLFQTLDDKAECVGIYFNNQLLFDSNNFPQELSGTWSYSPYLRDFDVDYASLYLEGKPLSDNIPEFLQDDWNDVSQKILAFKRSLEISKVNQDENCFFDLVPHRFLKDFCEVKNSVTKHIFDTLPRPTRYEFYKHVSMLLGDISCHKINIDKRKVSSFIGKNSFPILTLNKSLRTAIKPTNDYFVELDYNGAEVRTLLGMLGSEQPLNDVHEFHLSNVFGGNVTREQSKILFFSWLYGSKKMSNSAEGVKLENFYDRIKILEKYYTNSTVTTPYGKVIKDVAPRLALNYLVQSTTAELTLKQALKIDYLLRNKGTGSRIAFLIHDAIVLDVKKDDKHLLPLVKKLMASTNFGKFMINTKIGYSLGSMMREKIG